MRAPAAILIVAALAGGCASTVSDRGRMPHRIHVIEDFETEIERRWWLRGTPETEIAGAGGRACRAAPSRDFDDKMGDPSKRWAAVVFNPVPGPPMGKNTRLAFRYRLEGTDSIRVQIFSLTRNYHRKLLLSGLPKGSWQSALVDMTAARRPDGSGGPLSEDERIDDIQFYVDPEATLLIDDIALFDAARPEESTPFPKRPLFTAWFDTGKQGQEWPGDFEIVSHEKPRTWKAARSVAHPEHGRPWVRLHLRGERPLGEVTRLRFRYRLKGADSMRLVLAHRASNDTRAFEAKGLARDDWSETTVEFAAGMMRADEIRFHLPAGSELLLDDVLLYEP